MRLEKIQVSFFFGQRDRLGLKTQNQDLQSKATKYGKILRILQV